MPSSRRTATASGEATPRRALGADARTAAREVAAARRALAVARRALADHTAPGTPPVIVGRGWRAVERALVLHRARLLAIRGVVGVGTGFREHGGRTDRGERCVVVHVRRKRRTATLARAQRIPRTLALPDGGRVPVDVRAFGTLDRQCGAGGSLGPDAGGGFGTLGVFARDLRTDAPLALTAMHVLLDADVFPPGPVVDVVAPARGLGAARALGTLLRGRLQPVDAAAVRVRPGVATCDEIAGIGTVRGWRPLLHPEDIGTAVQMHGAASGRVRFGRITDTRTDFGERFGLPDAFLVDIPSADGDSGAALLDNDQLVLGLLVGVATGRRLRVFTPIASVLAVLACDIPSTP